MEIISLFTGIIEKKDNFEISTVSFHSHVFSHGT